MSTIPKPVIFTTGDYIVPTWAGIPQYQFLQGVIKEGCIVGKIEIKKKQFSLIGRLDDLCDIFIDNPTVSRKQAVLQFQKGQSLPLLYDLSSAQGTYVNKQKLLPMAYKKLQLFTNIKFGISSRYYILRCPQLQQKQDQQQQQKQHQFMITLNQQNKILTKQQAKKKYMQLLQNDPYHGGQLKSRKFQGAQKPNLRNLNDSNNQRNDDGITWGISDENQVYAYKNDKEFPIEPDVIRRLPGLDQNMLHKITQYEEKFRRYDQIQSQLNQLAHKQKRQFGLQQKLQNKKQRLQKNFVQSLQALEMSQDWIRVNIFGQENTFQNNKNKKKQKQVDTFSDDEFYDRTLQDKKNPKNQAQIGKQAQNSRLAQQTTVEDLWQLKKNFTHQLAKKRQFMLQNPKYGLNDQIQPQTQPHTQHQQHDQLELFMKQNNQNLEQQNKDIFSRQIQLIQLTLKQQRNRLLKFLSQKQITKMQLQILDPQKVRQKQLKKQNKHTKQRQKLQETLKRLEEQQKNRLKRQMKRHEIQKEIKDQYSEKLFELYKMDYEEQEKHQKEEDEERYADDGENGDWQQRRPRKMVHVSEEIHTSVNQDQFNKKQDGKSEEEVIDLTSKYN